MKSTMASSETNQAETNQERRLVDCVFPAQRPAPRGLAVVVGMVAVAALSLLLNGCSEFVSNLSPTPTVPSNQTIPSPTPLPLPENATVGARILARGYLRVGIRYDIPPFGYITDEGGVAGFGVDMGHELARRWLGNPQAVEFQQIRTDTAIEHLQAGNVDIVITNLVHTQEREELVDFTLPFFIDGHALLIRTSDAVSITEPGDLQGRPIAALSWTDAADVLQASVPFTLTFRTFDRFDAAVAALGQGEVDAVTELRSRLFWGNRLLPETTIVGQHTSASVAFAFPEDNAFFADLVNLTFQEIVSDGTYAEIYTRWFPLEYPPTVEHWPGSGSVPSLAETPQTFNAPDTIAAIQQRGYLVVAMPTDRSPFAYLDAAGVPVGYEVNLVQRLAGRWLGDPAAVSFVTTTIEAGREMVHNGQADIVIGGLRHTRALERELDFSLTTYWGGEGLLVWAGTPITNLMALNGQPVAVLETSQSVFQQAMDETGARSTVMPQPTLDAAVSLLEGGYVVAVVADRADMLGRAYATPGMGVLPMRLAYIPMAVGLPPGDSDFRDLVNLTLLAMKADGEFDALYTAWFDDSPPTMEAWPGAPTHSLRLTLETQVTPEG